MQIASPSVGTTASPSAAHPRVAFACDLDRARRARAHDAILAVVRLVAVIALIATPCACGSSNDASVVPPVPAVPSPAPDVRDAMPDSPSLAVTTVNPPLGPAGQWVYVGGRGFEAGATVSFPGAAPVPAHVYRPDLLGFTVPPGARGSSPVTVECRGRQASSTESFTIGIPHDRPAITRFLPTSGRRGTFVVVDGDNFVHGQTTVLLDHASIEGHVYGPRACGST